RSRLDAEPASAVRRGLAGGAAGGELAASASTGVAAAAAVSTVAAAESTVFLAYLRACAAADARARDADADRLARGRAGRAIATGVGFAAALAVIAARDGAEQQDQRAGTAADRQERSPCSRVGARARP